MPYTLSSAKVWDGAAWVQAAGGASNWWSSLPGAAPVNSGSAAVAPGASPNTKGAWTQLIASTTSDISMLVVRISNVRASATNTACLVDIGIGAASSETVLVANIPAGGAASDGDEMLGLTVTIPIFVASGTRISARSQSVGGSGFNSIVTVETHAVGDVASAPTSIATLGANTTNSRGVEFGGSWDTWVEHTASTAAAYSALILAVGSSNSGADNFILTAYLGTGAAASEVEVGRVHLRSTSVESIGSLGQGTLNVFSGEFAAGTRLAIKITNSDANSGNDVSNLHAVVFGVPA